MSKTKPLILLSLRNTAPKGDIFYSLVMRFKQQERLFPIGSLDNAREAYMTASQDRDELEAFWKGAVEPEVEAVAKEVKEELVA